MVGERGLQSPENIALTFNMYMHNSFTYVYLERMRDEEKEEREQRAREKM